MNIPTNAKEALEYKQWITENGYKVTVESPKDCELPELPEGCVVKEELENLTGKVTIYFRPELFKDWWEQFISIKDNKFILDVSFRSKTFVAGVEKGKAVLVTAEKFAELEAAKLKDISNKKTFYFSVGRGEDQEISFNQKDLGEAAELSNIYSNLGDFEEEPGLEDVVERLLELERGYEE